MDEEQAGRVKPPRLPPVIERKPSDANAREVIAAASRGERLWLEGEEGIVQPMEVIAAASRGERANLDRVGSVGRRMRVSFEPMPLPKNYSLVHGKTTTVRRNEEDEEGA